MGGGLDRAEGQGQGIKDGKKREKTQNIQDIRNGKLFVDNTYVDVLD